MRELSAIESDIGYMPGCDALHGITSWNRALIKEWLNVKGIDASRTEPMRDKTLFKAYNSSAYLRAMLTRGDYAPGAAKAKVGDYVNNVGDYVNDGLSTEPLPEPHWNAVHRPIPAPAPNGDAGAQLAALIGQLASGKVDEGRVIELIREHAPKPEERVVTQIIMQGIDGTQRVLPKETRHTAFADILMMVEANIPVMLVGPAGAGKTTLGHQIARALELSFSHTGAVSSRFELSGFRDAHGNYQATAFRNAYEHGGLFLFDEIDGSDPAALLWCNTAIANGVCAFPDGNVDRHPDFRLIACANTYGRGADRMYVGRNPLDGASLDRFCVVDFDYDELLERAVFGDTEWTRRVQKVRAAIIRLKLRMIVSPRATDYGARLLSRGIAQAAVEAAVLWKGIEPDQIAKINAEVGL